MKTLLTTLLLLSTHVLNAQIMVLNYEYEDSDSHELEFIDHNSLDEKATWFFTEDGEQIRCTLENISGEHEDEELVWKIQSARQLTADYIQLDVLTMNGAPYVILINLIEEHVFIDNPSELKASLMRGNVDLSLIELK